MLHAAQYIFPPLCLYKQYLFTSSCPSRHQTNGWRQTTTASQQAAATDLCMWTITLTESSLTTHHTVSLVSVDTLFGTCFLLWSRTLGFEVVVVMVNIWVENPQVVSEILRVVTGQFILHQCGNKGESPPQRPCLRDVKFTKALRTDTQRYPCSPSQSRNRRTTLKRSLRKFGTAV